ncbi:MAG: replicative DNA helicase [Bacteroidales bacterium]|nr:replicative DNA helicase [Bacteroidales bacterium]
MAESKRTTTRRKRADAPVESELGRQQPQALDFEAAVIGACLIEQDAFGQVADMLKPESFYDSKHEKIYRAIQTLSAEDKPIDILTVTEELRSTGELEEVGGPYYISELTQKVLSSAHIEYHAKIIAQKSLARQLITYSSNTLRAAFDDGQDINELMQRAEGELFEISKTNMKKDFTQINPVIKEAMKMLQSAAARKDGLSGLSSGFDDLDKITNGWQKSDLIIIAARPAMGKTAFVLSMAKNIAIDMRKPVAMFSLEMSNVQLVNRLLVNVCEITGDKIRSGNLAPYEWGQLDVKSRDMYDAPLYIDDTPSLSVFELRTKARRLVREHHVELIIIDYLQLMNASGMSYGSRQEEVSTISRSLKGLAKELDIPIIALSQLNRAVENRVGTAENPTDSKRPQLSDLRESGAIEQDADMVLFIHRPEYYKIYEDQYNNNLRGIAELIIAKHRNGAVGDVRLRFVSNYARFLNMNDHSIPLPGEENGTIVRSKMNKTKNISVSDDSPIGSLSADDAPAPF